MIDGINSWAVSVVRYSAGIVEEVANMDRRTRKILAMIGCLHTRSNRDFKIYDDDGRGKRHFKI